jgi:hypothetical protein
MLFLAVVNVCGLSPLLWSTYEPPASRVSATGGAVFVNCLRGNDGASGATPETALQTVSAALKKHGSADATSNPWTINVAGGMCPLAAPLRVGPEHQGLRLVGDGKTAISGGAPITGWTPSADHPGGKVFVADTSGFPLDEIKSLRLGGQMMSRTRWPKLSGSGSTRGLTSPNWLFAMQWSSAPPAANRQRGLQLLGVDPATLPEGINLSAVAGFGFVHVLGCVEKDVNSQLTRVLAVENGASAEPQVQILFRNQFTVNQRYYFENVPWDMEEGEFYHDMSTGKLYAWPPAGQEKLLQAGHAIAPVTDLLLEVAKTSDVVVSNLTFLDTTYYADGFWDGPGQQPSDAAVRLNYGNEVHVEGCNFLASLGGYGVGVGNATQNSSVSGCLFDHMGEGGVFLYGYDRKYLAATARSCGVTHVALDRCYLLRRRLPALQRQLQQERRRAW